MQDVEKLDRRRITQWLAEEVEIRVTKLWLVVGAASAFALLLIALD
jgi:hypothetical protein